MLRRPELARAERIAIVALTGATAYGVAIYSYFDNRSTEFVLTGVALPALLTGTLWLGMVLRSPQTSLGIKRGSLLFGLSIALLVVAVSWSSIGARFPRSALAYALPGGESLRSRSIASGTCLRSIPPRPRGSVSLPDTCPASGVRSSSF